MSGHSLIYKFVEFEIEWEKQKVRSNRLISECEARIRQIKALGLSSSNTLELIDEALAEYSGRAMAGDY